MGTAQAEWFTAQAEWLLHRMNLLAQRAALRLQRLADGPYDIPETWTSLAKRTGLYCVPLSLGQVSGRGYYCSADMVRSEGWSIPHGWGVIFYDASAEPIEQCRILVHELAHDTLEGWEATALPDEPLFVWEGDPLRLEDLARLAPVLHGYDTSTDLFKAGEVASYPVVRQGIHHLIARRTEALLLPPRRTEAQQPTQAQQLTQAPQTAPRRKSTLPRPTSTLAALLMACLGAGCAPKQEPPRHLSGITTPKPQSPATTLATQPATALAPTTGGVPQSASPTAPTGSQPPPLPVHRAPDLVRRDPEPVPQLPPTIRRGPQTPRSPQAPNPQRQTARESRVGNGWQGVGQAQGSQPTGQAPLPRTDMVPGTNLPRQGVGAPGGDPGLNGMPSQYGPTGQGGLVNLGQKRR